MPSPPRSLLPGLLALTVTPVFLLADTVAAFARGWWTTSAVYMGVVGLSAAVLLFALGCLGSGRGRAFLRERRAELLVLNGTIVVGWLALEFAVGLLLPETLLFHRCTPGTQRVNEPRPEVTPGVSGTARYTVNSLGIRGPELPARSEALRILCIGGSTTACVYLDDEETWPRLLMQGLDKVENGLRVWAGDIGQSGYGTWHHVRFLESTRLMEQMDCAVVLLGVNDFMRALQGRRIDSALGARPLWDHSNVLTVLHNIYQGYKEQRQHREEARDAQSLDVRRLHWQKVADRGRLPDLSVGLGQFTTNLRSMIAMLKRAGVRPVFMTQPVLWQATVSPRARQLLWLGFDQEGSVPPVDQLALGVAQFNQATRTVCRELGVECIDLTGLDGNESCFYDDCHFTEEGARQVARTAVGHFLQHGIRPRQ